MVFPIVEHPNKRFHGDNNFLAKCFNKVWHEANRLY